MEVMRCAHTCVKSALNAADVNLAVSTWKIVSGFEALEALLRHKRS